MGKKVRIKDIANKLGLSTTLVSLVLNSKGDIHGIKKQTQEKVFHTARLMGYFKHDDDIEEQNDSKTADIVGMIVPSMTDPFVFEISQHIQKAFADINIAFSMLTRDPGDMRFDELIYKFRKTYCGLILAGDAADENTIRYLKRKAYPFVLLEKDFKKLQVNSVYSDLRTGYNLVSHHIYKLGYRNITLVNVKGTAHLMNLKLFTECINSICKDSVLNKFSLSINDQSGEINIEELSHLIRPPVSTDILVIAESFLVYPLMRALNENNIRIPSDLALLSLQDGPGFDLFSVPVTRLRRNLNEMAIMVSGMLWSEVKNAGKGKLRRKAVIKPKLLIRRSCGSLNIKSDEN